MIQEQNAILLQVRQQQEIQNNISTAEMKLNPIQRPNRPPELATKVMKGMATSLLIFVTYGL